MPYIEMKIDFNGNAVKKFKEIKNNYETPSDKSKDKVEITIDRGWHTLFKVMRLIVYLRKISTF